MFKKIAVLALGLLATTGMASAQVGVNVGVGLPLPNGGYVNIGGNSGYQNYPYGVPNQVPVAYPAPRYSNNCAVPVVVPRVVKHHNRRRYVPVRYQPVYRGYGGNSRGCR